LVSSAILYVAIVAIWAGVLIPRWLRRDSAASQRAREELTRAEAEPSASASAPAPAEVPGGGGSRDREHTKVLASRRRLLYLLLVLALGSGALAVTKMAAWWVVVPPTIMLLSYMGMLREAAKADAERRELAGTRTRTRAAAPVPAAPSAPPAPRPEAEVIDISASLTSAGQEFYDQYADAKLRAVGDLAFRLTTVAYGAGEAAVMRSAC
jgi:hypothetical protein